MPVEHGEKNEAETQRSTHKQRKWFNFSDENGKRVIP